MRSRTVSATAGYGIDCFLDDVVLSRSLAEVEGSFLQEGLVPGVTRWLRTLARQLVEIHEEALYADSRWRRRIVSSTQQTVDAPPDAPQPAAQPVSEGYREIAGQESPEHAVEVRRRDLQPATSDNSPAG